MSHSDHLNERFAGTFRKLFDTIERGDEQCSIDRFQTLIADKANTLSLGLDAFRAPSAQSRTKVTGSTSVSIDGKSIQLNQAEKDLVVKLSDFLQLNELQCVSLWVAFKKDANITTTDTNDYKLCDDQNLIVRIAHFYHQDRIALLQCIASLLRITFDEEHPYFQTVRDTICPLFDQDEFFDRIFQQLKALARAPIAPQFYISTELASAWAKQNLREQKGLLDIIFLIHLEIICAPKRVFALIQEFEATQFGQRQATGHALDQEGRDILEQVSNLSVLISVEILHLNIVQARQLASLPSSSDTLLASPEYIVKISHVAAFLGSRPEHGAFLLGWSYFMSAVESMLRAENYPATYANVKKVIDGELQVSATHLATSKPSVSGVVTNSEPTVPQTPEIYRRYAIQALKLHVFDYLSTLMEGPLCSEEDANNLGYRSVIKSLYSTFLSTTEPCQLHVDSYSSLIQSVSILFSGQPTLCAELWNNESEEQSLANLLVTARGRFPACFTDLTQLLTAFSGVEYELDSGNSAEHVFNYLCNIPTMTIVTGRSVPLQHTSVGHDEIVSNTEPIHVTRSYSGVNGLCVPANSMGVRLSPSDECAIVQWQVSYSGWHLLASVLAGVLNTDKTLPPADIIDEQNDLNGQNLETVGSLLKLIHSILEASPSLVTQLVQHIEEQRHSSAPVGPPILIGLICDILSVSCTIKPYPDTIIASALRCITALLPVYQDEIWSYLEFAPILPRSNTSHQLAIRSSTARSVATDSTSQIQHIVSNLECKTGRYTLLLAFLNLVKAMVRNIQRGWWVPDTGSNGNGALRQKTTNRQRRVETLYLCLHYLMLDVFPSYATWRYKELSERFLIGSKVLTILIEITYYFKDSEGANQQTLTIGKLREGILSNFLYDGGVYHIAPLLDLVTDGAAMANDLYRLDRQKEAHYVERLTEQTFVFIKLLLQKRLETLSSGKGPSESALEQLMLEMTTSTNSPDFLHRLSRHIYYRRNIMLPILATNVISLLCRTLSYSKTIPNFVQHLGDKEQAQDVIRTYLSIAQDHEQSEQLLASIWQMMSLLLETQPSLAILFLECGENIMPSPKSAVKLLQEQKRQADATSRNTTTTESAIRAAVDMLGQWQMLSVQKPTALSNSLRFLATLWQTTFEHYAFVQRARSDNALWHALENILLNPSQTETPLRHSLTLNSHAYLDDPDGKSHLLSSSNEQVRQQCCLYISKAFVMRIMAFEIHLTAGTELIRGKPKTTKVSQELPAGLKSLLAKLSEPSRLTYIRTHFIQNQFDAQLSSAVEADARALLNIIGSTNVSQLVHKLGVVGFGDDDAVGEQRQYGDNYYYDLRVAEVHVDLLSKDIAAKYNVVDEEDIIVTPEVMAVRQVKKAADRFLTRLCLANHNWSLADAETILLRSFKVFIETASAHVGDVIWSGSKGTNLSASSLFDFLMGLTQQASEENRDDEVALVTYYNTICIIRGLTEDWIEANRSVKENGTQEQKRMLADMTFTMLSRYCSLLRLENFALLGSISDQTAIPFHRPLLEAILLPLRTLRRTYSSASRDIDSAKLKTCLSGLMEVCCESFQMFVYKAAAYGPTSARADNVAADECVKDLTVALFLLIELIHPSYQPDVQRWLPVFHQYDTIPTLLRLVHGGIALVVSELESQSKTGDSQLSISPYAENALYLVSALSTIPSTAAALVDNGMVELFCNNAMTSQLQQGKLDMFIRYGEQNNTPLRPGYVERSPLHVIWCHMLDIMGSILRTLGNSDNSDKILRSVASFIQIYGSQVDRTFANANGANDTILGLSPSESLSSCQLHELELITMIMLGLAKRSERVVPYGKHIFIVYKDFALQLLQRYLYYLTHPAHLQAQLFPINSAEKKALVTPVAQATGETTTQPTELTQTITHKAIRIARNMLTTLLVLTDAETTLTKPEVEWPFGNTILYPHMRVTVGEPASFGTLIEFINTGLGLAKQLVEQEQRSPSTRSLVYMIESCLLLLTSQVALWIAKPDLDDESRKEMAEDTLADVTAILSKVEKFKSSTWAGSNERRNSVSWLLE